MIGVRLPPHIEIGSDHHNRCIAREIGVAPRQYVRLPVSDTGEGMSPKTCRMALEPFFITKSIGHGAGLGLSMVFGCVKHSGGHIMIYM